MSEQPSANPGSVAKLLSLSNYHVPELYDLSLSVNHLKPNFNGDLTISLVKNSHYNGSKPSGFLFTLHAKQLVVFKANVDGTDVSIKYDRANNTVVFSSDAVVPSDECKLTISYMGKINAIKTYKDATQGLFKTNYLDSISGRSDNYILATHFQPHGAKYVFPVIDELQVKVPFKLAITTLNKFKVMSNGKLVSQTPISMSDQTRFEFATTPPMACSVFAFCIGDFEYIEEMVNDIPSRIYTTIGDSKDAHYALQLIKTFLPILQGLFKVDYPLEKLDFVTLPFLNDGAMENWGLVTIISGQLLVPVTSSFPARYQLQQLVAHELVHQWIGNLVSFDDWNNLWLNESFATWLGNYVIKISGINDGELSYNNDESTNKIELMLDEDCFYGHNGQNQISSISQYMNSVNTDDSSTTSSIFNNNAYEKGIILLQNIFKIFELENRKSEFFAGFTKIIETFKYKSIKAFDMWNILNEFTTIDMLSFVHAWLRYPGYPLVSVKANENKDKLTFTQHRYLFDSSVEELKLEDQPFHIPLYIKIIDKIGNIKILNIMLTDRSIELDIPVDQLVIVNSDKTGYYRVAYKSDAIIDEISKSITSNKLSPNDIISILNDYGKRISTSKNSQELIIVFKILEALCAESTEVNFDVLKVALGYLETINDILIHFSEYEQFEKWLQKYVVKLFEKIGKWDDILNLNNVIVSRHSDNELAVRNTVLLLGLQQSEFQKFGKTMFKNFTTSGVSKKFTPKQLVSSMFNLTIANCTSREYKNILEFVKNSDTSLLNNSDISNAELQTIAVTSLGFVDGKNEELTNKTLNFIMTNIDSKLIELGIVGYQYKTKQSEKLRLFNWYKLHYDKWILKSLRKGSDWAKQLGITMENISRIVLGDIMNYDSKLIELKEKFIKEKLQSLPPHGLQELVDSFESVNENKRLIASYYDDLINCLTL